MIHSTKQAALGGFSCALSLAVLVSIAPVLAAQEKIQKETFNCWAVSMGTVGTGRNTTMQINITRWTTDDEREKLIDTLVENGSEELLKSLQQEEETGYMRISGAAARLTPFPTTRFHYAREMRVGGKRIIRLATDRPIGFWEARANPRSMDYTFTLIELLLDEKDEGTGILAAGVEMKYDKEKKVIQIKNRSSEPIRLTNVRKSK